MIALIDYGAGNTASVANALENLNAEYVLTNKESDICKAQKVIFPGVGEASFAIKQLHKSNLFNLLRIVKKPMLGICLGMQLMCEFSTEGNVACLGIIPGRVEKFDAEKTNVPHMGWNEVFQTKPSKLFEGIKDGEFFYFANSFYMPLGESTIAKTNHGIDFTAAIEKDNFFGVQFHPEKSAEAGLKLLQNFLNL
ncbi:MAG: imidazole glycerol phosphate synthase subunit HisH [Bacteroidota bacterium]|jgi:glutamine amidotransferase|nr:imidazole glycerol phosphate synthase subunit HisH [Bacteroidota bacterium]MDP4190424.1 imidazole glycerol phosphate synthase subunit HisH [Bacteroidota bacterium]MDP4194563.1 imidazole glycerol phosphate synthase subunit HisH [Bacteroidota bacterium]